MSRRFDFEGPRIEGYGVVAIVLIVAVGGLLFFNVDRIGVGYVAVVVDPVFGATSVMGTGGNAQYFVKAPWRRSWQPSSWPLRPSSTRPGSRS